ncbi:hypothetical protein BpHYR1_052356 [Brachionus plicatilis]|uniref:Uncharacterized protein n=1 Tax=Brachionus plicatilis TaxID=10195 RepID=A0A3M7T1R6_BRAPC|nr:hypothetical protein BpHYR1_052356 [Brachionus plicatilis]
MINISKTQSCVCVLVGSCSSQMSMDLCIFSTRAAIEQQKSIRNWRIFAYLNNSVCVQMHRKNHIESNWDYGWIRSGLAERSSQLLRKAWRVYKWAHKDSYKKPIWSEFIA